MGALLLLVIHVAAVHAQQLSQQALNKAFAGTDTAAIVLDASSGRSTATFGHVDHASSPGSTLKPFILAAALLSGIVSPHTRIACIGTMRIGQHNLACSHPRANTVLDAQQALANSCNTYFVTVARQMQTADLIRSLRGFGIAPNEIPATPDDRALLALGLSGVDVSPRQLALAYRKLALSLASNSGTANTVREGMLQSVSTGMAHAAGTDGVTLGGKTGSAHDATGAGQHGWFAGILFTAGSPHPTASQVLVIQVPGSNGNDAANLAHDLLKEHP